MKDGAIVKWLLDRSKNRIPVVILLSVLNMVSAGLGILTALYSKEVIDAAFSAFDRALLQRAVCLMLLILVRLLLSFINQNLDNITEDRMTMELRAYMMHVLMRQDYRKISRRHTGELMTRITSDVQIISSNIISLIPNLLQLFTRLVCAFVILYRMDHRFAVTILLVGCLLFLLIQPFRPFMKRMHKTVQEKEGKLRAFMQELLESQLVIRVFHVEEQAEERMAHLQNESYRAKRKRRYVTSGANVGIQMVFQAGYIYALVWSAFHLGNGTISAGTLTAVLQLVNQIQNPLMNLAKVLPGIFAVLASAERLMELEADGGRRDENTENSKKTVERKEEKREERKDLPGITGKELYEQMEAIEVQDVTFAYEKGEVPVLEHAELSIEKGEFATIVGPSGIGKSTLMKLLLGVYPIEKGRIGIRMKDGSFREMTEELQSLYAYVPQGNFLFSGTIEETLCFFRKGIRKEEIREALRISCAEEFVNALPDGLDTMIGERGLGLSEGQMQRLAIARALLCKAPVLMLDEATSALDAETELRLLEHLRGIEGMTCLFITHRAAANAVCTKEIYVREKRVEVINGEGEKM